MLTPDMTKCLLVRGYKKDAGWGFPRGKLSKDESDAQCAVREVRAAQRSATRQGFLLRCHWGPPLRGRPVGARCVVAERQRATVGRPLQLAATLHTRVDPRSAPLQPGGISAPPMPSPCLCAASPCRLFALAWAAPAARPTPWHVPWPAGLRPTVAGAPAHRLAGAGRDGAGLGGAAERG